MVWEASCNLGRASRREQLRSTARLSSTDCQSASLFFTSPRSNVQLFTCVDLQSSLQAVNCMLQSADACCDFECPLALISTRLSSPFAARLHLLVSTTTLFSLSQPIMSRASPHVGSGTSTPRGGPSAPIAAAARPIRAAHSREKAVAKDGGEGECMLRRAASQGASLTLLSHSHTQHTSSSHQRPTFSFSRSSLRFRRTSTGRWRAFCTPRSATPSG